MKPSPPVAAHSPGSHGTTAPRARDTSPRLEVACSCGETEPHEIARCTTADGYRMFLASNGEVSTRFGIFGRFHVATMRAGFDLVSMCDIREVSSLIREWKRARSRARATDASAGSRVFAVLERRAERLRAAESPRPAAPQTTKGDV